MQLGSLVSGWSHGFQGLHPLPPQAHPSSQRCLGLSSSRSSCCGSQSLGNSRRGLGEIHFADLVPSLLSVLRTDSTGVGRQGSAQGLAEILAGLGVERMEALLPEIINSAHSPRSYVREGHISLLIYLPATFGHRFSPHLGRIIPPILGGIADETESVREASMRAGRMIIANYSSKAVDLLLPELEKGMTFWYFWKERGGDEEGAEAEENAVANSSVQKALVEALGQERRDRILAGLYIVRQDPNIPVRQAAIQTWKALVHNTPRTAERSCLLCSKFSSSLSPLLVKNKRDGS
ncbi:hypothetical protein L7F22_044448 [Adiantum nelumboides]|nr:hypothetical protein [Adiantum nelumboides]